MTMKPIYRLITAVLCAAFVVPGGRADDKQIQAQKQQRKVDYYYFEGLKDKQAGRHDVAYDHFRYCISLDSTAAAPLYELAVYALQLRKPELSLDYLRRAVKYDPTNYTYRLALASLSLYAGMYGEAAELYRELVHEHPAKPELIYYLAEALNQAGQTGEAIDRFNELENTLGVNEALSMQKYKLYMQMEQRDKAYNELQRLADNNPGDVRYPIMIGDLLLENGDTAGALSSYEAAHEIDPTSPYYPVSMANYYEAVGDRAAAENQIRTALVDRELDVETKMGILARYLRQLHQTPDALPPPPGATPRGAFAEEILRRPTDDAKQDGGGPLSIPTRHRDGARQRRGLAAVARHRHSGQRHEGGHAYLPEVSPDVP